MHKLLGRSFFDKLPQRNEGSRQTIHIQEETNVFKTCCPCAVVDSKFVHASLRQPVPPAYHSAQQRTCALPGISSTGHLLVSLQMAAEERAIAAEVFIGPPPPEIVQEAEAVPGDARSAEVVRVIK